MAPNAGLENTEQPIKCKLGHVTSPNLLGDDMSQISSQCPNFKSFWWVELKTALYKGQNRGQISDIDDVINTSKMSDMRQNSYNDLNVLLYCTYQISSPCKVITHLPWPIYLKKTPQDLWGGVHPPIWKVLLNLKIWFF